MEPATEIKKSPLTYEVNQPEKKSIFGSAKVKAPAAKAKTDKATVQVPGLETKLLALEVLKAEIADREAQLTAITDEVKDISREKFVELYKANKDNPNSFLIQDGNGCVMVIPSDKYISIKDEARAEQLMKDYGKSVVTVDERFYFNPEVLERNMDAIEKLILDATTISESDKENLLSKEVKYSITKGTINNLLTFKNMENVLTDIQPIFMLKNCGGKMAKGGALHGEDRLMLDVPVVRGYSLCHYAPVYAESDVCSKCGDHCIVMSENEFRNELAEMANEEGSEENEQRWEAKGYADGGTIQTLKSLLVEEEDIYSWMSRTQHPSQIRVWSDYASALSAKWTEKSNRLNQVQTDIEKIIGVKKGSKNYQEKIKEVLADKKETGGPLKPDEVLPYWNAEAKKRLLGKTITNVRFLSAEEGEPMDIGDGYNHCMVIQLNDGSIIYPMADDEGNDFGFFDISGKQKNYEEAMKKLPGSKVEHAGYANGSLKILLSKNKVATFKLSAWQDPEGNGPGSVWGQTGEEDWKLPRI